MTSRIQDAYSEELSQSTPKVTLKSGRPLSSGKMDLSDLYQGFTPNYGHVGIFMFIIALCGTVNGYGLSYTNNTMPVINAIYGWDTKQKTTLNDSLIGCAYSLGAGIGASTGGRIIKAGRRRAVIISCLVGIVGCVI
mgnify:FL=1